MREIHEDNFVGEVNQCGRSIIDVNYL